MTEVRAFERGCPVAFDIGDGRVHILAERHEEGVAHLIGVHLMTFVMQKGTVALHVVEREVDVTGIVGEDGIQIIPQGLQEVGVIFPVELLLEFDRQVGDQMQVVVQRHLLITVAQILIDHRAAREENHHCQPEGNSDYAFQYHIRGYTR